MANLLNLLGSLFHTELTDLSGSACLLLGLQVNFQASLETKAVQGHDNVRYIDVIVKGKAGNMISYSISEYITF